MGMRIGPFPWQLDAEFSGSLRRKVLACDRLLAVTDRLEGRAMDLSSGRIGSSAAYEELMRATKTFRSVLLLLNGGFGQQGMR